MSGTRATWPPKRPEIGVEKTASVALLQLCGMLRDAELRRLARRDQFFAAGQAAPGPSKDSVFRASLDDGQAGKLANVIGGWSDPLGTFLRGVLRELREGVCTPENLEMLGTHSALDIHQTLLAHGRHPREAGSLGYLMVCEDIGMETVQQGAWLYDEAYRGGYLYGPNDNLAVRMRVGAILLAMEELDPYMAVSGPGIEAAYERAVKGEDVAVDAVVDDLMLTFDRLAGAS
jgi:hypothetical protein